MAFEAIAQALAVATGQAFLVAKSRPVSGGSINQAVCLEGSGRRFFVKFNAAECLPMFQAEAAGLQAMAQTAALRVPRPIAHGLDCDRSWLALEFVDFGRPGPATSGRLGEGLATLHGQVAGQFGWSRDNTIGSTAQLNTWTDDWKAFFADKRLAYQLSLARQNGAPSTLIDLGQSVREAVPQFFSNYEPVPSLLHGDLWSGNCAADTDGEPVVFDPATYYGDREADLAMTELFGGFDDSFYEAYSAAWRLDPGYSTRKDLYNLYHVLNHFNLFGGGYAVQANDLANRLLAQI